MSNRAPGLTPIGAAPSCFVGATPQPPSYSFQQLLQRARGSGPKWKRAGEDSMGLTAAAKFVRLSVDDREKQLHKLIDEQLGELQKRDEDNMSLFQSEGKKDAFLVNCDRTKPLSFSLPLQCIPNIVSYDSIFQLPPNGFMVFLSPALANEKVRVTRFERVKLEDGTLFVQLPDYPAMIVNNGDFAGSSTPSKVMFMPLPMSDPKESYTMHVPFLTLQSMAEGETPEYWEAFITNFTENQRIRFAKLEDFVNDAKKGSSDSRFLDSNFSGMLAALEHEVIAGFAEGMHAGLVKRQGGATSTTGFYTAVTKKA